MHMQMHAGKARGRCHYKLSCANTTPRIVFKPQSEPKTLGARDAFEASAGVDAGRTCSIQAIEAVSHLRAQDSAGIGPGTLRPSTSLRCPRRLFRLLALRKLLLKRAQRTA
jgi:hypothetical protein